METPLVSAIITTHNRLDLVLKAIKSVKNQTYNNLEVIVVDDASLNETQNKLSSIAKEQGFLYIYIPQNESHGGSHARNVGILAAQGKYVAFLDDDDEWFPEKIDKQITILQAHPENKVCYCGRVNDYNYGEKQIQGNIANLLEGDLSKKIFIKWQCFTSEMLVERELLLEVGMFDENLLYWQDYELCMRLFQKTNVSVVRENLVLYRIIQTDTNRLTNKLDGWEETVSYIYNKHKMEMDQLPQEDRMQRDYYWCRDGAFRGMTSGNKKAERKYLWKKFLITKNIKDLAEAIFNVYSFKNLRKGKN